MRKKTNFIMTLDEDFEMSDVKEGDLRQVIKEMTESTVVDTIKPSSLRIYSIFSGNKKGDSCDEQEINVENKNMFSVAIINPDACDITVLMPTCLDDCYFTKEKGTFGVLPFSVLKEIGFSEKQIEEIDEVGFFFRLNKSIDDSITLIPSKALFATFCRRLGIGTMTEGKNTLRDIYLGSLMRDASECKIVYRKDLKHGYAKAFACFTTKYAYTPQSVVYDFMDNLANMGDLKGGHLSVRYWKINHFVTIIDFALNEIVEYVNGMKVTPGVRMVFSDVGDAAFSLQSIMVINGGTVLLNDAVSRKHSHIISADDMVSDYETVAYPNLINAMEKLKGFAEIQVPNKKRAIMKLLSKIKFRAAFGTKYAAAYQEAFFQSIPEEPCTGLDVVMEILKIPGNIQIKCCTSTVERTSLQIGSLFNLDMKKVLK